MMMVVQNLSTKPAKMFQRTGCKRERREQKYSATTVVQNLSTKPVKILKRTEYEGERVCRCPPETQCPEF